MPVASLAGRPFRLNPLSVAWDYTVKTSETPTVGGIVVQVFGVDLGDMTVQGTFGSGGWREQEAFLAEMKKLADRQASNPEDASFRFFYPDRGWNFQVMLREFTETGGTSSVVGSNENFAPKWTLRLFILEDNSPVRVVQDAALLQYLNRLSSGLGWQQTKYNGPITDSEVASYVHDNSASTVAELLARVGGS